MIDAGLLDLLPIVILGALGILLRRQRFLGDGSWPQAERLSYYVLLPSLCFQGLATAQLGVLSVGSPALMPIAATLSMVSLREIDVVTSERGLLAHLLILSLAARKETSTSCPDERRMS